MELNKTVRKLRELNDITQEEMAERLNMSTNGYAKMERGISKLNVPVLERIAAIFNMNLTDLLNLDNKNIICLVSENSQYSSNYYAQDKDLGLELEKMQLMLSHKDQLLQQKEQEIAVLKQLVRALEKTASIS